jgi:hypothetical protein
VFSGKCNCPRKSNISRVPVEMRDVAGELAVFGYVSLHGTRFQGINVCYHRTKILTQASPPFALSWLFYIRSTCGEVTDTAI